MYRLDLWKMLQKHFWIKDMLLLLSIRNKIGGIQFVKLHWYFPSPTCGLILSLKQKVDSAEENSTLFLVRLHLRIHIHMDKVD